MGSTLAIDPGAATGWALYGPSGLLASCGVVRGEKAVARLLGALAGAPVSEVVIERPHPHRTKARRRDVLTLAVRAGEWGGLLRHVLGARVTYLEPAAWKGTVGKVESHARILERLTEADRAVLAVGLASVPASLAHNALDAVGIGLLAVAGARAPGLLATARRDLGV